MAARKLNRQNQIAPELALAQGPMPMSRLGGEVVDEACSPIPWCASPEMVRTPWR